MAGAPCRSTHLAWSIESMKCQVLFVEIENAIQFDCRVISCGLGMVKNIAQTMYGSYMNYICLTGTFFLHRQTITSDSLENLEISPG